MTLTSKPLAILVITILFGGILFSSFLGWWSTESSKVAVTYTEGEFAGQANPADIRGSYTFGDVQTNFGIPAEVLAQAFAVQTDDPAAYQAKNLETQYEDSPVEIGTASVRLFVAFYLGLPFDLSTDIYLPQSAASLLQGRPMTPEQAAYLETHVAASAEPGAGAAQPTPTPQASEETQPAAASESTALLIKGKTTFAELLDWGLSAQDIEQILGAPMPASAATTLKDFCSANGLDFETIKPALQAALEAIQP
ncbi:MAG: hypothetical protein AB1894_25520 [Chloroflexota bacterium]